MADPLSTAASIIAVLQLSSSVLKYINTAKGCGNDRRRLRDEIRACEDILSDFNDIGDVDDPEEAKAWKEKTKALEAPGAPLGRLALALRTVDERLRPKRDTKTQKTLDALKWPFKEKEVGDMIAAIEREKSLLQLALQSDTGRLVREINSTTKAHQKQLQELLEVVRGHSGKVHNDLMDLKGNVSVIRDNQEDEHNVRIRDEISKWLMRMDYAARHSDFVSVRLEGTGLWLLDSEKFATWVDSSKSTLFCPGIPGAGKTILTSIVVDHLLTRFRDDVTVGIAYVYCDFNRPDDQTAQLLLMDILNQLSRRRPSVPDCMRTFHSRYKDEGLRLPSIGDVFTMLNAVCQLYEKVFILVDALDECSSSHDHRPKFLKHIIDLQVKHEVNIFATSRPIPEITDVFAENPSLRISAQSEDVGKYVDEHLPQLRSFVRQRPDLQVEIKRKIVEVVDGMFLLARLHLDSLADITSVKAMKQALAGLPSGQDAITRTYEVTMRRIQSQSDGQVKLAKEALSWITCWRGPNLWLWPHHWGGLNHGRLTVNILRYALAVEIGEPSFDEENLSSIEDILSVCAGLVTIDTESDIVRLVHYTAQEFFVMKNEQWLPNAQTYITRVCVTCLSFSGSGAGSLVDMDDTHGQSQSNRLYAYAACNWGAHAQLAAVDDDSSERSEPASSEQQEQSRDSITTQRMILAFLAKRDKLGACNESMFESLWIGSSAGFDAMHTAAFFGLNNIVVVLLRQGHAPDGRDSDNRSPLWWASRRGHAMVVETLLQTAGVEPNSQDAWEQRTPLLVAARCGHLEVVKVMLTTQDDNPRPEYDSLIMAHRVPDQTRQTETTAFRKNATGTRYKHLASVSLSTSISQGEAQSVKKAQSRKYNIDVNVTDYWRMTPLCAATKIGHEAIVAMLLRAEGVDVNARDEVGWAPLVYAVRGGYNAILNKLLAIDGLNVDPKDAEGRTPLSHAVGSPMAEATVQMLLAKGVDVNSKDDYGRTPLLLAVEYGATELLEALVAADGIEVNCKNHRGQTPLILAVCHSDLKAVKVLVTAAAIDLNLTDDNGQSALAIAIERRDFLESGTGYQSYEKDELDEIIRLLSNAMGSG